MVLLWDVDECPRSKAILALCDLQILLGLSALVAGFIEINTTPAFYWRLLVYVAWFSFLTNQCALIFCRPYLRDNVVERNWRVLLITILFVLLFAAAVPLVFFNWDNIFSVSQGNPTIFAVQVAPLRCYLNPSLRSQLAKDFEAWPFEGFTVAFMTTMASLSYLLLSYTIRMVQLFQPRWSVTIRLTVGARSITRKVLAWVLRWTDKITRHKIGPKPWFLFLESPLLATYAIPRMMTVLLSSALSDLSGVVFGCLLGISKLVREKQRERLYTKEGDGNQNRLTGFGQLLPVVLLLSPLITVVQSFRHRARTQQGRRGSISVQRPDFSTRSRNPLVLLNDRERWSRIGVLLTDQDWQTTSSLLPTMLGIYFGELYICATAYFYLVAEYWPYDSTLR